MSKLLPYEIIVKAHEGDPDAIDTVLSHYAGYIRYFSKVHGQVKVNPKLTAHQIELSQVEAEIEKLLDTLTGANAILLAYANKKIEELDTRRQTISKAIAELSVETMSSQKEQKLSYYLDH